MSTVQWALRNIYTHVSATPIKIYDIPITQNIASHPMVVNLLP